MDWPGLVRKYVWDPDRTPYFVRADRLSAAQARSELFTYAFLLICLSLGVMLISGFGLGSSRPGALGSPAAALYALTVAVAAAAVSLRTHPLAALYCATAPVALLLGVLFDAIRPGMGTGEQRLLALFSALWLLYAVRVVRIARGARAA